jgi:hypothetical protein
VQTTPIALGRRAANEALGLGADSEWLLDPDCPIPKCDIRKPGARVAMWVWDYDDLRAFVKSRKVQPGHPNPQER